MCIYRWGRVAVHQLSILRRCQVQDGLHLRTTARKDHKFKNADNHSHLYIINMQIFRKL